MMFEFNKSGELDPDFTKLNPFFFSFQFEGSQSRGDAYRSDFYLLDLYGTKYHYLNDFGSSGKTVLTGVYDAKTRTNRNISVLTLKSVINSSTKEFTDLPQSKDLGNLNFNELACSNYDVKKGFKMHLSPPWHKHLNLSIWFYNEFYNFYQECLLWAEVDSFGGAVNKAFLVPEYEELRNYCRKVFALDF